MNRFLERIQQKLGKLYTPTVMLLFSVLLFLIAYPSVRPKTLDVELYHVAKETIRATTTVEDKEKTEEARKLASEAVSKVFHYYPEFVNSQTSKIEVFFVTIDEINTASEKLYQDKVKEAEKNGETTMPAKPSTKEKVASLKEKLATNTNVASTFGTSLPDWSLTQLFDSDAATLKNIKTTSINIVSETMKEKIAEDELAKAKQKAKDKLDFSDLSVQNQKVANLLIDNGIITNNVLDEDATEVARAEAKNKVQPTMILQGQVIVQEGHIVDNNAYRQIELVGLLDKKMSYQPAYGLMILLVMQAIILIFDTIQKKRSSFIEGRDLTLYGVLVVVSAIIMKSLELIQSSGASNVSMIYPAAMTPLLLTLFISRRYGIISNGFLAAYSLFIFMSDTGSGFGVVMALYYALSGMIGAIVAKTRVNRQLLFMGIWLALFNLGFMLMINFYQNTNLLTTNVLLLLIYGVVGGLMSFVMALAIMPFIDLAFEPNAVLKMTELSNPNQPLLKRILTEAPGTYHHSIMVANLSANAVQEIGGDSVFARVACYYHDVGKLTNPMFFVENLPNGMVSPHDQLTPEQSRDMILSHVTEGVRILTEEGLPQTIIDICAQHHGTTLMRFFYVKAKEQNDAVTEAEFRYPGPKPQTKEAVVINIADSAEAAARAMSHPSLEEIENLVYGIVKSRVADGQFNESDITLKELQKVAASIINGLNGTFHSRIKYPKVEKKK